LLGKLPTEGPVPGDKGTSDHAGTAPPPLSWKVWGGSAILVGAIFAAYANSFHGPFIFDDGPSIMANPSIRHLGSPQVFAAPSDSVTTTGRPILNLSFAINYAIGGLTVEGYHVANLIIHILAALTLFGLLRRSLLLPTLGARLASDSLELSLAISLLWAVHPLQTESVTYIVQRAESLAGLFYLLTLYCYLRGATAARGGRWYTAAVLGCALGMGSKEVMVSAPLMVMLFDRVFIAASFEQGWQRRGRFWLALMATWGVLVVAILLSHGRGGSAGFGLGMTAWSYARTQFTCIIHYLRLSVWPSPLVLDYGNSVISREFDIVPYALGVILLVAATVAALVRRPLLGFTGVFFFTILAPSSSIVPLAGQTEAEHRMYLPLAAVVVLAVLAAYRGMGRWGLQSRQAAIPWVIVVAALGIGTYRRNEVYQTELAIWDDTVRSVPRNSRALLNRGNALVARGELAAAIKDYDDSIAIDPGYAKEYKARGSAYVAQGRYEDAIRDYEKAIKLKADFADAHNGLGSAYGNVGRVEEAIKEFGRAIELNPEIEEAYFNRGTAFYGNGQIDVAIENFGQAIKLRPDYAEAFNRRGSAYEKQGQLEAAINDYDRAIALQPGLAESYGNRGNVYAAKGQYQTAIRDYDRAIDLNPDFVDAFQYRALAYLQIKSYDKAWADVLVLRRLGGTPIPAFVDQLTKASGRSQ
jgi:protein O-mannosyl-transferase